MNERQQAVRALLESQQHGVLATLSARHNGWPFASVTPYALTEGGVPLLLLSALAEHTRNLHLDPRASLFVQAESDDPQATARVTLLGRVESADEPTLRERYVARHPQAASYLAMADFKLYVLKPESARLVGGFGDMGWIHLAK